ncbi:MAG: DUF5695 domain-containing protein [Armatimonadetes bacterium]|nr:DUF5695 domain-containing protein [Armatimonadota bacterium]
MKLLLAPISALLTVVACSGVEAQAVLSNNQFTVTINTTSGGISSLKLKNDVYDTDYIWSAKIIGDVTTRYRVGTGAWTTGNTSVSSDNRTIVNNAPTKVQFNYITDSTNASGIKNFSLYETYEIKGDALIWTVRFKNRNTSQTIELGTLGLPLFFNTDYDADQTTIMTQRVIRHSFISGDGSYIFCGRSNGIGPYLVMTPAQGSRFEYFTDSGSPYDYTAYIHSNQKANPAGYVGGAWRLPITSKILAKSGSVGDEVTYAFKFTWANDYNAVRQAIVRDGLIDAQSVPGMSVPQNTNVQLSLTTNQTINSITAEYPASTTITDVGRKYGNVYIYNVQFSKIGENKLTVDYGAGRKLYLEYFCMQPVETLIKKRATFISTKQQWKDPAKWYNGLFSLWDMKNQVLQSPDNPGAGMMAYCVGGSDDPSNCKGPYLALKNLTFPVQSEIDAVDYHLQNFVWGGLQRTNAETPYPYGVYGTDNWYVNRNAGNYRLARIYDYPAMIAMYYNMYKIAKTYPTMPKYLTASGYLDRAFGTAQAFFTVPLAIWGWASYTLGLYNEQCIPDLVVALYAEGRTADANWLKNEWEKKVKYFIYDDPWPYGSEYSFDSTAYETSQLLARYGVENAMQPDTNLWQDPGSGFWYSHPKVTKAAARDFMEKQMSANIADRGWLEPCYYQLGSDIRGCSNALYIMTYMSQMGGTGVLDYALYYSTDPATYLRVGYASYMSCWALINAGDTTSNYGYWFPGVGNDGAAAWAYEPLQTGKSWCNGTVIGRWGWNYDGEIDHGFMGGLRSAATIVSSDPIFGLMAYGGTISQVGSTITVTPKDGLRQRFHMTNVSPGFHMELNRDSFMSINATTSTDNSVTSFSFTVEKLTYEAHTTDLSVQGLPVGDYNVLVGSTPSTFTMGNGVNVIHLSLPMGASSSVSISLTALVHGTIRNTSSNPIPNAVVQIGGYGGPAAITDVNGAYSVHIPATGNQTLYADALGYGAYYSVITIPAHGGVLRDITLSSAVETGVIANGDFETAGGGGGGSASGWQWVHTIDPTGVDFLGIAWPAMNSNMYAGTRSTGDNQTPGGLACGILQVGTPLSTPGAVNESTIPAWGTTTSLTVTTVTVPGVSWTTNQWAGYDLILQTGTTKKRYSIASNTANVITISSGSITGDGFTAGCGYEVCKLNREYWYPGWLSQTIAVEAGCLYNFYFKGKLSGPTGAFWKLRWLDANYNELSGWVDSRADATWPNSPTWQQYLTGMYWNDGSWHINIPMLQMAPPTGTKYVEIAFGFTDDSVQSRTGTILVDDVVVDKVQSASVASTKSANIGDFVMLQAKTVTLAPKDDGEARTTNYFYVEEANRSCGLRVEDGLIGQDGVSEGQTVSLSGFMRMNDAGERYIELSSLPSGSEGWEVAPLAANSKSVLNDNLLVGELVKMAGKVKTVDTDGLGFTVSDGYAQNGEETAVKVLVESGEPITNIEADDYVIVTGVVSKEDLATRVILLRELTKIVMPGPPPPPPVIFARYKFDETSGTVASDFTGNGWNGTLVNGPTWVAGKYGNAVNLDGSNDYINLPTGIMSTIDLCTLTMWVKLDANNTWNRVFDFGSGTGVNMFLTPKCSSGAIRFSIKVGGGEQQVNTSSTMPTDSWQHIAITLSGPIGIMYLNGVEVGRNINMTYKPSSMGNTTQNWLGRSQYSDPYYDGLIDDFRIYNGALSADQITQVYNNTL